MCRRRRALTKVVAGTKDLAQIEGLILGRNGNMLRSTRSLGSGIEACDDDTNCRMAVKAL